MIATLHALRALGVRISMDDFGTGYSSLSYLRSFPFDKIKIDRSFVHDIGANADSQAIVRAIVSLGASLGIKITAEGVETESDLAYLKAEGCTEGQGFLFSKAQPQAEVLALLGGGKKGGGRPRARSRASHIHLQGGDERLLRDVDLAELAHLFLPFFCLSRSLRLRVTSPP